MSSCRGVTSPSWYAGRAAGLLLASVAALLLQACGDGFAPCEGEGPDCRGRCNGHQAVVLEPGAQCAERVEDFACTFINGDVAGTDGCFASPDGRLAHFSTEAYGSGLLADGWTRCDGSQAGRARDAARAVGMCTEP